MPCWIRIFCINHIWQEIQRIIHWQNSCNIFRADFFDKYYGTLANIDNIEDLETFLAALKACDDNIPHQNGLGKKKNYVLIHKYFGYEIKSDLSNFSEKISKNLKRPQKKFVLQMLYGILEGNKVHLSETSRLHKEV